jgi:blue copper oxidase
MEKIARQRLFLVLIISTIVFRVTSQQPLFIPDTLSGTNFNLLLYDTTHSFYNGYQTSTYGVNAAYLGPTLFINKGDSVNINVVNHLIDTTTIHWHGLHVSAHNDGGPHTVIPPGNTWTPGFKVRDHAATYWYHPHLHKMTNLHATKGAAGIIIVRDSSERQLNLPRKYGIDDFPLVVQSKCFDATKQIAINNPYDSVMLVNGTRNANLTVPAQVVRLRLLNASSERVYNFALQNDLAFFQIGSDGGLLNAPVALTRLRLSPGERAEILVDFSSKQGQVIKLLSRAAELPNGLYGAFQAGMGAIQVIPGYSLNPLNGSNFTIMTFSVTAATVLPVTTIPSTLTINTPWPVSSANGFKTLTFSPANPGPTSIQGPFFINNAFFDMHTVNFQIQKDNIEVWTLTNNTPIAHPFHIHDVQFFITELNGLPPPANISGRKDVVLVPAGQTVKFITKFETFCDPEGYYMYHCHMLTHEDDGMMGQFAVVCPPVGLSDQVETETEIEIFPNPSQAFVKISCKLKIEKVEVFASDGKSIPLQTNDLEQIDLSSIPYGLYHIVIYTEKGIVAKKISKL